MGSSKWNFKLRVGWDVGCCGLCRISWYQLNYASRLLVTWWWSISLSVCSAAISSTSYDGVITSLQRTIWTTLILTCACSMRKTSWFSLWYVAILKITNLRSRQCSGFQNNWEYEMKYWVYVRYLQIFTVIVSFRCNAAIWGSIKRPMRGYIWFSWFIDN